MVGIFKAQNPFNIVLLFIYGLLLKLPWLLHPHVPLLQQGDGFLFKELLLKLQEVITQTPVIYFCITYILIFIQAIAFNKIINAQKLLQRNNYLAAMSYLLITSMFSEWNILSAPLIINTLLILVWALVSSLGTNANPKSALFNIGLIIGLSSFFYFPSLVFTLLIIFALIISRPFKLPEWIIAILGTITPYYFLFAYLFLSDKLKGYKLQQFQISYPHFQQNYWWLTGVCLLFAAFIIGAFFVQSNFRKQLVQVRKKWSLILLYLLVAVINPFINATHTFEFWILTVVPLSAYIASAFFYSKRWLSLLLHWLMVLVAIVISYGLW